MSVRAWCSSALCSADRSTSPKRSELRVLIGLGAAGSQLSLSNNRNIECWVQVLELVKIHALFSFFFQKYTVSFAGREGATGPKGSPGSPGTPGFPGAQVRLVFHINIQIPQELFQRNLMASVTCSVILGDLNRFFPVV